MRPARIFELVTPVLLAAVPALAAAPQPPGDAERKAAVRAVIAQWADARVKGDAAFLERFYAPELRIGTMNGGLIDRDDDIALFARGQIKPDYIHDTDTDVQLYGGTAVVTLIETLQGTYRGVPGKMSLRMLNVLAFRDGRWQLVGTQSAAIPAK